MEDADISSHCSETSVHSELSNTSSLSIYKAEFLELHNALDSGNNQLSTEDSISLFSQSLLFDQQNELWGRDKKYLEHLEKKLELRFHSQIEQLIRHKSNLEAQLESAHKQISRLINNYKLIKCGEDPDLERKTTELENDNRHLYTENANLLHKIGSYKSREQELESELHQLKTEINQKKDLVKVRDVCIEKFKVQVSQQCVEIQKLLQINNELSHKLSSIQSELEHSKKSEVWYREQLLASQDQKKQMLDELSEQKNISLSYHNQIDQLNLEVSKIKSKCEQSRLEIVTNRKYLHQNHIPETTAQIAVPVTNSSAESNKESDKLCNLYQQTIKELTEEMNIIKKTVSESQITIKQRNKENSELTAKCIKLQKLLQSKENDIEHLESTLKRSAAKPLELTCEIHNLNKQLLAARADNRKLKLEWLSRSQEKEIIESTVSEIRDNFTKLKTHYEKLKAEINVKDKHIIQLETEKQELFMNNNWKICELEKIKNNGSLVNKLKEHIDKIETEKAELLKSKTDILEKYDEQRTMLGQELYCLKTQLLRLEDKYTNDINDYMQKVKNCEDVIAKYKTDVMQYQNEIENLKPLKTNATVDMRHEFIQNLTTLLCVHLKTDFKIDLNATYVQNTITKSLEANCLEISCDQMMSDSFFWGKNHLMFQTNTNVDQSNGDTSQCSLSSVNITNLKKYYLDNITQLQALVQVKEMEKKHVQYKNEITNRTLLRKVKEHMKGRRAVEKCNIRLQALCKWLSQENNFLKIKLESTHDTMLPLLEEQLMNSCFHESADENVSSETFLDDNNKRTRQDICLSEGFKGIKSNHFLEHKQIEQLKLDVQALQLNEINVSSEKDNVAKELECKNDEIKKLRKQLIKMKAKLEPKEQLNINLQTECNAWKLKYEQESAECKRLKDECTKYQNEIECLKKEIESMNRDISHKCEQLQQIKQHKQSVQEQLNQLQVSSDALVTSSSTDLEIDSCELDSLRNEKFFLQRLCNDLKAALRSNIDQNTALKEHISHLSQEQQFSSLPNILPSLCVPSKLDEEYIKKLLSKHKTTVKPLGDIQKCLESLKQEVFTLRKQVEEDTCKKSISFS